MRSPALLAAAFVLLLAAPAQARLFRQTYGATVPTDQGCVWNINQDYFVPRHCDSCRYDLFSACKRSYTRSPACFHQHPVFDGYCTPYTSCRYKWRDHVYKKHCGCTPLRCEYGKWHLKKCRKHALVLRDGGQACSPCNSGGPGFGPTYLEGAAPHYVASLHNIEPYGGETLGSIPALPAGAGGSASAAPPVEAMPTLPPKLDAAPAGGASAGSLPAPFDF